MIIDVAALDVLDSFGSRTLRTIAEMARLRGALTVIVGIQPDVAFAMVALGMATGDVTTASTSRRGLAYLDSRAPRDACRDGRTPVPGAEWTRRCCDRDYRVAFLRYLPRREEAALHRGYELGRAAVADGVSMLDWSAVHHDVLLEVLRQTPAEDAAEVATAASEFLVEVLATVRHGPARVPVGRAGRTSRRPPTGERVQGSPAEGATGR